MFMMTSRGTQPCCSPTASALLTPGNDSASVVTVGPGDSPRCVATGDVYRRASMYSPKFRLTTSCTRMSSSSVSSETKSRLRRESTP